MPAHRHFLVKQSKISENNGRNIGVVDYLVGEKRGKPIDTREKHLSMIALERRAPGIKLVTCKTIFDVVVSERFRRWIELREATVRAYPKIVISILKNPAYSVIRQAIPFKVRGEGALSIKLVQPFFSPNPDGP